MQKTEKRSFFIYLKLESPLGGQLFASYDGQPVINFQGDVRAVQVLQIEQMVEGYVMVEVIFLDEIEEEYNRFKSAFQLLNKTWSFLNDIHSDFNLSMNDSSKVFKHMKEISQFIDNNRL